VERRRGRFARHLVFRFGQGCGQSGVVFETGPGRRRDRSDDSLDHDLPGDWFKGGPFGGGWRRFEAGRGDRRNRPGWKRPASVPLLRRF
jgi:hypothetical protein